MLISPVLPKESPALAQREFVTVTETPGKRVDESEDPPVWHGGGVIFKVYLMSNECCVTPDHLTILRWSACRGNEEKQPSGTYGRLFVARRAWLREHLCWRLTARSNLWKHCRINTCTKNKTLYWPTCERVGISQVLRPHPHKNGSRQRRRCWARLQMSKDQMAPCDAAATGGELSVLAAL